MDKMFINYIPFIICIIVLPSIYNLTVEKTYYIFSITLFVLILSLLILIFLPISFYMKILIISILLYIYRINIDFISTFMFCILNKDRLKIRQKISNIVYKNFSIYENFNKLPKTSSILLANYALDRYENILSLIIPGNVIFMMRKSLNRMFSLDHIVDCIETSKKNSYEYVEKSILKAISENKLIFCYPCESRFIAKYNYGKMHSGIFRIAHKYGIPITLLHFDYIDTKFGIIYKQSFYIKVGETFLVKNIKDAQIKTKQFFREETKWCIKNKVSY